MSYTPCETVKAVFINSLETNLLRIILLKEKQEFIRKG